MTILGRSLGRATAALCGADARFALVGGLAVSARAEPRFTRDADLAVAVSDDREAEAVVLAMAHHDYHVVAAIEHGRTGRLATIRLADSTAERSAVVDLLFASSGIENEIVAAAEELDILRSVRLPVARVGHLIATKLLSRDDDQRPTDRADLIALADVANESDWMTAAAAVVLISERGYDRGRDLASALLTLQAERRPGDR